MPDKLGGRTAPDPAMAAANVADLLAWVDIVALEEQAARELAELDAA